MQKRESLALDLVLPLVGNLRFFSPEAASLVTLHTQAGNH
jgi:hypothetical protein